LVVIVLGANDAYMKPHVQTGPFMARFHRRMGQTGIRLVWVGMPKLPLSIRPTYVRNLILETGVVYLDSRPVTIPMWEDQLHPTFKGREIWATWIWKELHREQAAVDTTRAGSRGQGSAQAP